MKKGVAAALIALAAGVLGMTVYHLVHHELYCKYKGVPGKSHCRECGHRKVCQKYHKKKWQKS